MNVPTAAASAAPEPTVPLATWARRIEASRRRRDQYLTLWETNARLHTNAYIAAQAKNDDQLVTLPNGDQVKLGLVFRNIEQTLAILEVPELGVRATVTEYTREVDQTDTHREAVVEAATVRSMKRSGLVSGAEIVDAVKRDGVIIGHGISYSWWRMVQRSVPGAPVSVMVEGDDGTFAPQVDAQGRPVIERPLVRRTIWQGVQDEQVSPLEFLFDAEARSMVRSPWHGMEKIVKADTLRDDPEVSLPAGVEPTSFTVRDLYGEDSDAEYSEEDSYRLIKIWDKANYELVTLLEGKQNRAARSRNAKRDEPLNLHVIDVKRWPVTFDHPDDSPFSFFIPIPANDQPFGISQIEHIRNPSVEADKTRTRMANLVRQLKRLPIYRKGSISPEDLKAALDSPDTTGIGLDLPDGVKLEDVFKELATPSVHPDMFRAETLAEDTVRKTSGISETPFGGAETATESENMAAVGSARPNRKRRLLLAYLSDVARKHVAFLREFAPPGQPIDILGEDGTPLTLYYGREAFAGEIDVEALPGGGATTVSPVKQKMMIEAANLFLGRFSPQFDRVFARQLLTVMDFRDINKLLQAIPADAAAYMNLQASGGVADGRGRAPGFNPRDQSQGQAIRAAINAPSEGRIAR